MTANTITDVMRIQTHVEVDDGHMRLLLSRVSKTACTDTIKRV